MTRFDWLSHRPVTLPSNRTGTHIDQESSLLRSSEKLSFAVRRPSQRDFTDASDSRCSSKVVLRLRKGMVTRTHGDRREIGCEGSLTSAKEFCYYAMDIATSRSKGGTCEEVSGFGCARPDERTSSLRRRQRWIDTARAASGRHSDADCDGDGYASGHARYRVDNRASRTERSCRSR